VLKTFKAGGIHPPQFKLSADKEIVELPLSPVVFIPVSQHIGVPAALLVKKGDKVKTGQLIAKSSGFVSANIHSSVSGTVLKVESVPDAGGYPKSGIIIRVEGDEWEESIDRSPEVKQDFSISGHEVIQKIMEAGIVGMGGAAYPTHGKMIPPKGKIPQLSVINGVECEPFLTSDNRLMIEKTEEILVGARLIMRALNVQKSVIAIENNKPEAIEKMRQAVKKYPDMEVVPLKVKYPQGGEKQLIKAITGREVPSGKLPVYIGCVVNNVGTALAVYEAIQKNKPLFERVVTVTGEQVKNPSNLKVRIGTPFADLISFAGGVPEDTGKVISGGPMMGRAVSSLDVPVTKGITGIVLIPGNQAGRQEKVPCIRCSRCATGCPMGLEPYLLTTLSEKKLWERAEKEKVIDCIECGSCSYSCPSNRPLLDYIRLGKSKVLQIMRNRKN
jgi:Na+-translocating ferredoxin:NAD+ oxidoreductase subunit C